LAGLLAGRVASADGWRSRLTGPRAAEQLSAPDAQSRREAARTLGRDGDADQAVEALVRALRQERDASVRRAVVRALARRGSAQATPAVVEAFREGDRVNRAVVAHTLAALGTEGAIEALVKGLGTPETMPVAIEALRRVGTPAVPALLGALRKRAVAAPAARVLGAIGHPMATPALVRLLGVDSEAIRTSAVQALGRLADPRAARAVAQRLADDSGQVVLAALRALRRLGAKEQWEPIAAQLEAKAPEHRRAALRALAHIDPPRAARLMERRARSKDDSAVSAAVDVALEVPHAAFVPLLHGIWKEGTRAGEAASALAEVDSGAGVGVLAEQCRAHPDNPALSRALAVGLRKWGPQLGAKLRRRARSSLRRAARRAPARRGLLLRALAGDRRVASRLVSGLRGADASLRAVSAHGLQLLGARDHREALVGALRDESDPEAFRRMARATWELGARVALSALWEPMRRGATRPEAMILAAKSMPEAPRRSRLRLRERLRRELRSAEPRTRAAAARALAEADDRAAWRALVERLEDGAAEVRLASARALQVLAVAEARPGIEARRRVERNPRVRAALADAASAPRRRPLPGFQARGSGVLRVGVAAPDGQSGSVSVDVVLRDGRWLKMRTLETGELLLADLPAGEADVRVRVGP
jgi:HEAT repeat protein